VLIGFTFGQHIWLTFLVSVIWGMSVIADSAQFSAAVSEFASEDYMGTALTFQMCVGFFITILSINLIPYVQNLIGWQWAFAILSIGPVLGIVAMTSLRKFEM
jgi:MFS family permease